jgi:hypothetical protein
MGVLGHRERWRLPVGDVPAGATMSGWFALEWDDDPHAGLRAEPVDSTQRLLLIAEQVAVRRRPTRPEALLELTQLPMWRIRRPRRLDVLDATVDLLRSLAGL